MLYFSLVTVISCVVHYLSRFALQLYFRIRGIDVADYPKHTNELIPMICGAQILVSYVFMIVGATVTAALAIKDYLPDI